MGERKTIRDQPKSVGYLATISNSKHILNSPVNDAAAWDQPETRQNDRYFQPYIGYTSFVKGWKYRLFQTKEIHLWSFSVSNIFLLFAGGVICKCVRGPSSFLPLQFVSGSLRRAVCAAPPPPIRGYAAPPRHSLWHRWGHYHRSVSNTAPRWIQH